MSLLALAVVAAPVAQDPTPEAVRRETIGQARAALARQDFALAIARLEQADAMRPDDAEVLRLLGSAYAFDRRYPQAITTLRRAEVLAPEDLDIRAALARAYLWSGDRGAAGREVAAIEQRSPENADAMAIRHQLREPELSAPGQRGGWGLAATQGVSNVSFVNRPGQTWYDTSIALFGGVGPATSVAFSVEREDRRIFVDTRVDARIDHRFGNKFRTFVAFAMTPNANFREKWGVTAGVEGDVTSFATLLADLRHAEYRDASVTVFQPGVRLAARKLGLDATVRMINLWDEDGVHRWGVSGRLDRTFSGGTAFYAGVATYPDTEAGITRQVHSFFAGATMPVAQRVSIRAGFDHDRRRATYKRTGASLGVQVRF